MLAVALVPFLVGAAIGAALARALREVAVVVGVGAAIALPLSVSTYLSYTDDEYVGPIYHGIAFVILSGFLVWVLGVGAGVGIGRLTSPVPKR